MAAQPISGNPAADYADDSRFERIDSSMVARPVPVRKHSEIQWKLTSILRQQVATLGGTALQEWSVAQPETAGQHDPNYMTPDVLVALPPVRQSPNGYFLPPGLLAVEISSPEQSGLITKAQRYHTWGIGHVWIINPESKECLEYHGGNELTIAADELHAGPLTVKVSGIFEEFS